MLEGLLRMHLGPIHEALAELHDAAEENRRQGNNLIAKGVVESVVEGRRIVVVIGENKTPPIQFFVPAAGNVTDYRCPSPGEIAIVLNFGAGDDFGSSIALCGVESGAFPYPTNDPNITMTKYGDNAYTKVDLTTGAMEIHAAGGVTYVDTPFVKNKDGEMVDKVRTMAEDRKIYDSHDHKGDSGGLTGKPNQKQGG